MACVPSPLILGIREVQPELKPRWLLRLKVRELLDTCAFEPKLTSSSFAPETSDRSSRPTLFARDLSLDDRVALVTGGNSGIGLEVALGFLEAGARTVYCVDLPESPSDAWLAVQRYATTLQLSGETKAGRLEYVQGDVTDQVSFPTLIVNQSLCSPLM